MPSWPPDLATALAGGATLDALGLRKSPRATLTDDPLVVCPCRRHVAASMMRDLRVYSVGELPVSATFVCDACWGTLERDGIVSMPDYATRCGAPTEIIAGYA